MAKKKEPDKLAQDAAKALAAGMSYGKWKALQDNPVTEKKADEIPENWQECPRCGKPFKPKKGVRQVYCEVYCQKAAQAKRRRDKDREKQERYRKRKKAEREEQAERMKQWAENLRKV